MGARRFFASGVYAPGDTVALEQSDARKIRTVLRLTSGNAIELVDSSGSVYAARLLEDDAARVRVERLLQEAVPAALHIDVAQGIPKGAKMDFIIEKLSELGVRTILPVATQRVRWAPGDGKIERWRRVARAAAAQSGRTQIAEIEEARSFEELLERFVCYDVVLFPWEIASAEAPLREILPGLLGDARRVLVVIGPEGGFSHDEAERASAAGARVISLGNRILRTETAALVLVAIVQYIRG